MKKLLLAAALCVIALAANAQTFKFGTVDSEEIIRAMPEFTQLQKEMDDLQKNYESELTKMGEEYQSKLSKYIEERESLEKSIAEARELEIQQLQQRIQQFQEMASRETQTQYQNKLSPILDKVRKAIESVGEKNGFTFIFETNQGGILYKSSSMCTDCTQLVKTELGIK